MKDIIFGFIVGGFIFILLRPYFSIADISESIDRLTDQVEELRRDIKRREKENE